MKATKQFTAVPDGEFHPVTYEPGDEVPPELEATARHFDALSPNAEAAAEAAAAESAAAEAAAAEAAAAEAAAAEAAAAEAAAAEAAAATSAKKGASRTKAAAAGAKE